MEVVCIAPYLGSAQLLDRQIGFIVTTSYVKDQASKEIIEDGHPVVIISGGDIVKILASAGCNYNKAVSAWLRRLMAE